MGGSEGHGGKVFKEGAASGCWGVLLESRSTFGMHGHSDTESAGPGLGLSFWPDHCLDHESQEKATFVGVCFRTGSPLSVPLSQGSQTQFHHCVGGSPDTTGSS